MDSSPGVHLVVFIHGFWGKPGHLDYVAKTLKSHFSDPESSAPLSSSPSPPYPLEILNTKRNKGNNTYDGIERGAERVTAEIEEKLVELYKNGKPARRLSIVGYSLGGLIGRYVVGLLYRNKWFDRSLDTAPSLENSGSTPSGGLPSERKGDPSPSTFPLADSGPSVARKQACALEPYNFTTFSTPHLGTRAPVIGRLAVAWNSAGGYVLSASGRQLFLIDKFGSTGRPLLTVLANPDYIFMRGLKLFPRRSLYANILNDRAAPYYTTAIEPRDPFERIDFYMPINGPVDISLQDAAEKGWKPDNPAEASQPPLMSGPVAPSHSSFSASSSSKDIWVINYLPGYAPNIIDANQSFKLVDDTTENADEIRALAGLRDQHRRSVPARVAEGIRRVPWIRLGFPFVVLVVFLMALYHTVASAIRMKLHDRGEGFKAYQVARREFEVGDDGTSSEETYGEEDEEEEEGEEGGCERGDDGEAVRSEGFGDETDKKEEKHRKKRRAVAEATRAAAAATSLNLTAHESSDFDSPTMMIMAAFADRFPALSLSDDQLEMVEHLNALGWSKFPVFIHNTVFCHAAIIVRQQWRGSLKEGKVVVEHFVMWFRA